jgi:hypothetical protein
MTPAAYRALVTQGRAMNARYGNSVTALSAKEFAALYNDGGSKMSPEALNAVVAQSEAMNKSAATGFHNLSPAAYDELVAESQALNARYGDAVTRLTPSQFDTLYKDGGSKLSAAALNELLVGSQAMNRLARRTTSAPVPPAASSVSFAWDDFGLGASAAIGGILLLGGIAVATRLGRRMKVAARAS